MRKKRFLILLGLFFLIVPLLTACGAAEMTESAAAANEQSAEAEDHHDEGSEHHEGEEAEHHEGEEGSDGHAHGSHVEEHEEDHAHNLTTHDAIDGADEIRVVATEWGFEPASIHLHKGEAVNVVLVNEGTLEHEIELEAFDFHIHAQPGETVTAGFVPDETGAYEFACFVPGHYEAGMVGEVAVEDAH